MVSTTSATSSIISALGAGSGVNMVELANQLAEAQYAQRITQLRARSEVLDAKISTASALRSQITQLGSALGDRVRNGDLAPTPQIANSSVAAVTRSGASNPAGNYSLEVQTLASSQTLAGPAYAAGNATVGAGSLTLRFGTVNGGSFSENSGREPVNITVAAGATLADVARSINATNSGFSAYVANSADGPRLVVKGQEGQANGFVIEASETAGQEGLAALAWSPSSGDPSRLLAASGDAKFTIDGIAMKSASNKVGEAVPGINLTLSGTNAGYPTTISFSDASAAIGSTMGDLTSALNEIIASLVAATDPKTGDLARDDGARGLKRQLASLGSLVIMPNAAEGAPKTLAELGLSTNRDGTFSFNEATLKKAMTANPEAVAAMFTNGLYGVYSTIDKIARNASTAGNPGSLAGSVSRYSQQQKQISDQDAKAVEQQEVLRARLTKQFSAADSRVNASKSTLAFLQSQIALWNKSDN